MRILVEDFLGEVIVEVFGEWVVLRGFFFFIERCDFSKDFLVLRVLSGVIGV